MDLKLESLAGFAIVGTALGMIIRGWSSIKAAFNSFFRLFITQIHLEDTETSQAVLAHLVLHYKQSNMGEKTFGGKNESFRDGKFGHVPYEFFGGRSMIFWKGWVPTLFNVTIEKNDKAITWGTPPKEVKSSMLFIRGTINIEKIIKSASDERNQLHWSNGLSEHRRFFIKRIPDPTKDSGNRYSVGTSLAWYYEGVYRLLTHSPEELGKCTISKNGRPTNNLYFPPHIAKLIHEVEMWRKLQTWYAERAIPWKRGWVLHGPPGTGKTAIARAIAEELDMPLFVYALGHMLDEELERSWAEMQAHIPCVALFEDFDNVFHGRENVYGKATLAEMLKTTGPTKDPVASNEQSGILNIGRLSFDCLLNCLDGVEKSNGVFTIITTNHIDKLDEAMGRPRKNPDGTTEFISTRPGRIDKAIELTYMTNSDKLKLAKRIFFDNESSYHKMVTLVEKEPHKQETPAQFQERCAQMALELLWQSEHEVEEKILSNGNHKLFQKPFSVSNV